MGDGLETGSPDSDRNTCSSDGRVGDINLESCIPGAEGNAHARLTWYVIRDTAMPSKSADSATTDPSGDSGDGNDCIHAAAAAAAEVV